MAAQREDSGDIRPELTQTDTPDSANRWSELSFSFDTEPRPAGKRSKHRDPAKSHSESTHWHHAPDEPLDFNDDYTDQASIIKREPNLTGPSEFVATEPSPEPRGLVDDSHAHSDDDDARSDWTPGDGQPPVSDPDHELTDRLNTPLVEPEPLDDIPVLTDAINVPDGLTSAAPGPLSSPSERNVAQCLDQVCNRFRILGLEALSAAQERVLHEALTEFLNRPQHG